MTSLAQRGRKSECETERERGGEKGKNRLGGDNAAKAVVVTTPAYARALRRTSNNPIHPTNPLSVEIL